MRLRGVIHRTSPWMKLLATARPPSVFGHPALILSVWGCHSTFFAAAWAIFFSTWDTITTFVLTMSGKNVSSSNCQFESHKQPVEMFMNSWICLSSQLISVMKNDQVYMETDLDACQNVAFRLCWLNFAAYLQRLFMSLCSSCILAMNETRGLSTLVSRLLLFEFAYPVMNHWILEILLLTTLKKEEIRALRNSKKRDFK